MGFEPIWLEAKGGGLLQEDIERRTVAVSVKASQLTAKGLAKVLLAVARKIKKEVQHGQVPQGKQSVRKLMNHGVTTNTIPLTGETKLFDRVARKYNVDYAFHKAGTDKYLLFFKAGQADAITACFSEYSKRVMAKGKAKRPSIIQQLKQLADKIRQQPKEQERKKEVVRDER